MLLLKPTMMECLKQVETKDILFDSDLAEERIRNRSRDFYRVKSVEDLILTDDDFRKAEEVCRQEADIIFRGEHVIKKPGLFRGMAYCLLTPMQQYSGQIKGFNAMFNGSVYYSIGLDQPSLTTTLARSDVLFAAQKADYICKAQQKLWGHKKILPVIGCNLGSSKEIEEIVRDYVVDEFEGFGYKTASLLLRMCGSRYIVPVDSWMSEMLHFHGYPFETPRSLVKRERWETKDRSYLKKRKNGLDEARYLQAEDYAVDLAAKYGVPAHILQMAFWTKFSSFRTADAIARTALETSS